MYRCNNKECSNDIQYSDNWVKGCDSQGNPSNTCLKCKATLTEVEGTTERQSAMIRTRGCSAASKPFAH